MNRAILPGAAAVLTAFCLVASPAPAALPCCAEPGAPAATLPPDGGICLPFDRGAGHPDGAAGSTPADTASASPEAKKGESDWLISAPHGKTYEVAFDTDEATWINVDVSPDGRTLVFDVLGDLYTIPLAGGTATRVTSGPAYDHQPRFSPRGDEILFTSDRGGTDNVWAMKLDGASLRPLTVEKDRVMNTADWSPDGEYIVARKRLTDWSSLGTVELWMFHVLGGSGIQVTKKAAIPDANDPVFSPDGRWIYFSARMARYQYNRNVYEGIWQIKAWDRETGRVRDVTDAPGGSGRPRLSPDGKTVALVRRDREKTVLILHDLATGGERRLFDGLDLDMQENFAWTGIYPGYDWTPDGREIVISFGGGIHRVRATDGGVTDVPFSAHVEQTVTERATFPRDIAPDAVRVRMISWPQESPDGETLLFSALGRLYRMPLPAGAPAVLPSEGPRAYAPAWSRDGRSIAYVTWSDGEGGHVWVMPAGGGRSRRVTTVAGQYAHPAFSPDGTKLVFVKGVGGALRGRGLGGEPNLEIAWVPVAGGAPQYVISTGNRGSSRRMPRPFWSADGGRIYYTADEGANVDEKTILYSIRPDGTDRQPHLKVGYAEEIVPSPDGRWALFSRVHEGFLAPLPRHGDEAIELSGEGGSVPVLRFSRDGADWLAWSRDGAALTWGFGPRFFRIRLDDVRAEWMAGREKAGAKTVPTPPDTTKKEEPAFTAKPDTVEVRLTVPRARPEGRFALTGARLVTMKGDEVVENGTIVIHGDRIEAVGPAGTTPVPAGTRTIDVGGKTVIPGLIDAHAHLHYQHLDIIPESIDFYYANLAYGVTSTHDPSASTYNVFTQGEMVETGVTRGPRIWSTGYILYGADSPNNAPTQSLEDARRHVRRLKTLGAFSVKSYMQPRREQRQWILQAAREESMLVVPEGGGNLEMNLSMVLDGHTGIEHALPVTPIRRDVVRLFAETKTGYTPTLLVAYGGLSGEHWFYQHDEVWKNEKLLRFLPRADVDARAIRRPLMSADFDWHHRDVAAGGKAVVEAGGRVQLGAHGQLQGLGAHWELWGLTQGGMSNHDALRCATLFGAEYLGVDRDLGSIEAGKLADLVVLDGNPLADIRQSESIRYVVKNGELFDGNTMDLLWPVERPAPRFTGRDGN